MHRIKTGTSVFKNQFSYGCGWQSYLNVVSYLVILLLIYVSSVHYLPVSSSASVYHTLKSSEDSCLQSPVKYSDIFDSSSSYNAEEAVYEFEEELELRCEYCLNVIEAVGMLNIQPSFSHFTKQNNQSNNTFVLLRKSVILQV